MRSCCRCYSTALGVPLAPCALHKCNQDRLDTVEVHAARCIVSGEVPCYGAGRGALFGGEAV